MQAAIDENPTNVSADAPMVAHGVLEIADEGPAHSRTATFHRTATEGEGHEVTWTLTRGWHGDLLHIVVNRLFVSPARRGKRKPTQKSLRLLSFAGIHAWGHRMGTHSSV